MSWSELHEDDRMGYLRDYILQFASVNKIESKEDIWKHDLEFRQFMVEVMEGAGVFENDK